MCDASLGILDGKKVTLNYRPLNDSTGGDENSPKVYISYSSMDNDIAMKTCDFLESHGLKCWIAPRDIETADNYAQSIMEGLNNSEIVVLIASNNAYSSKFVVQEIKSAFENNKQIIPLNVDNSIPSGEMGFFLNTYQLINLNPSHPDFMELTNTVAKFLGIEPVERDDVEDIEDISEIPFDDDGDISSDETMPLLDNIPFPAYEGDDEAYAFVSYAHLDYETVYDEIERFHKQGLNIWYDEGIAPGNEWLAEIGKALIGASLFIVFISPNSVASKYVQKEINFAISKDIPFIAIHIEKTELPIQLDLALGDLQAILKYGMGDKEYYRRYTKAFNKKLKKHNIKLKSVDEL